MSSSIGSTKNSNTIGRGSHFAQGWRKLPDELKVKVFEHILTFRQDITFQAIVHYREIARAVDALHSTKAIVGLAKEVFYTTNTFTIDVAGPRFTTAMSKRSVNHLIRRLNINIRPCVSHWNFLSRISHGEYGFENLRHLRIVMDVYEEDANPKSWSDLTLAMQSNLIEFSVPNVKIDHLRVTGTRRVGFYVYLWDLDQHLGDNIMPLLFESITTQDGDQGKHPRKSFEKFEENGPFSTPGPVRKHARHRMILQY